MFFWSSLIKIKTDLLKQTKNVVNFFLFKKITQILHEKTGFILVSYQVNILIRPILIITNYT